MDLRIQLALRNMEANYHRPLCLSHITVPLYLSPPRFEHLFKRDVGVTYKTYLRELRLKRAQALLGDVRLNISEVAYKVGYAYPPNFARDFRNRFGKSPTQYRQENASLFPAA